MRVGEYSELRSYTETEIMMGRELTFSFSGYSGWDSWRGFLPKSWQTRDVALAFLKQLSQGGKEKLDLVETPVYIVMPWATYRIVDEKPTLKPTARERTPGL